MEKREFTIGVDVSKEKLDVYCAELKQHLVIKNGTEGFRAFIKWCSQLGIKLSNCILIMEHTGGYEYKLIQFCASKSISFCRVPGLAIKQSIGIVRGKNDKVDSRRIAIYGYEKHESLVESKPTPPCIQALKDLMNIRKKLVRENAGYKVSMGERKAMYDVSSRDITYATYHEKFTLNVKLIRKLESKIFDIIKSDEDLAMNYKLLNSIKGIGKINAITTLVYTENFSRFTDARKYGVYAGVVPFDHSSGSSIKGRRCVSHLANKEIKQELNQAAKCAATHDPELREYFVRLSEKNKHYSVILNNIKFKLIQRMFAVVKRQEMYVETYIRKAS
jgi:transposase